MAILPRGLLYKYYNETVKTKWQYTQYIHYTQFWDKNHRLEMMCLNKFCLNDASERALLKNRPGCLYVRTFFTEEFLYPLTYVKMLGTVCIPL